MIRDIIQYHFLNVGKAVTVEKYYQKIEKCMKDYIVYI